MTDTFGSRPQDQNENTSSENAFEGDHDSSMGAPTEAPSEYEFASDGLPPEESAPVTKRSAFLPVAAALAGIILLGGAAWWHMGGGSIQELSLSKAPAEENGLPVAQEPIAVPGLDQGNDGAQTADVAPVAVPTPLVQPVPSAPEPTPVASAPLPVAMPATAPAPTPVALPVSAPATPPVAASLPLPVSPVSAASAQPMPPPSVQQAGNDTQNRIEALTNRVESLQKALDQANQQLSQMSGADSVSAKDLEDRINKLEKRLGRKAQPETPVVSDNAPSDDYATPVVKKAKHKAEPKATKSVSKNEPVSTWVLRAASPGEGWIAANAEAKELKKVRVGDTVPGIGKVTAIENQGDTWIVRGTKGSIQ